MPDTQNSAPEQDLENLFPWYQSTTGPKLSMTISSDALMFLPVINLVLAKEGINILPDQLNLWVTLAVFVFFLGRSAYGYVRSKKVLGARAVYAEQQVQKLQARLSSMEGGSLSGPGPGGSSDISTAGRNTHRG